MQKSDLKILIIDDDPTVGKAVEESLRRSGYGTLLVSGAGEAVTAAKMNDFQGMVVDCMLPSRNGQDVALEILRNCDQPIVTIFTSGVFKDKSFAHDVLLKTKAKTFLHKPFDIGELIKVFDEAFADIIDYEREPLFQLFLKSEYYAKDKINAINQSEFVHGFDLPYIYSLLMDQNISGNLQIQYDENKPKTIIGFNKGKIDQVIHHDKESYFGILLVEKGFTTPEELQLGLEHQENTPIGQFLVSTSTISPHSIEIVQHEQMIIRLSKTIQDTSIKITFQEDFREEPKIFIDGFEFPSLLNDWILSKLSSQWLKSFYTTWFDFSLNKGAEFNRLNMLNNLPACRHFASLIENVEWPLPMNNIFSDDPDREVETLKGLHFCLVQRLITFNSKAKPQENFDYKISRLERLLQDFRGKNYFEILGVSNKARPSEINRAFHDLAKSLHPDKIPTKSPEKLIVLSQNVFAKITSAYHVLNTESSRQNYLKTLEVGITEEILKSESIFEEGMKLLKKFQFRDARKAFDAAMKIKGHRSDTIIYFLWALIKERRHEMDKYELADKIKDHFNRVPHEDRHSPPFFLIKGMYFELTGQIEKAYQHFKHCEAIDPHFIEARKEISFIKRHYGKNSHKTMQQDFATVVTSIFKKKVI